MDEIRNTFNRFANLMDQNIRGVQLGCYSVAVLGLTIAIRKVRPFSRFKRPSDIPNHFISERRELTGLVERIEPNGGLLMIRHKPLLALPGIPSGQLPVKISGVNVGGLGLSWLQTIVAGSEVKFVPVLKERDYVQCEVLMPQLTQDKKKVRIINVGEALVRIGFGRVVDVDKPISKHLAYYNQLQMAENYALRKKLGVRYYIKPTKSILTKIVQKLNKLIVAASKNVAKVPKIATS